MHAPSFPEGLSDLKIKDGDPLALKCVVSGDPDPQIEWFKNGEVGDTNSLKKSHLVFLNNL